MLETKMIGCFWKFIDMFPVIDRESLIDDILLAMHSLKYKKTMQAFAFPST